MKRLLFLCAVLFPNAAFAITPVAVPQEITSFVRDEGATRDGIGRVSKVLRADLDGDGDQDAVVQYNVDNKDGGNYSQSFLATFLNTRSGTGKRALVFAAETSAGIFGTAMGEQLELLRVSKRRIVCARSVYEADDGVCCPTPKGNAIFTLQNGKLRRLRK